MSYISGGVFDISQQWDMMEKTWTYTQTTTVKYEE